MTHRSVIRNLHAWFRKFGRDLPWRRTSDPYAILVAEVMLQQTQVNTVKGYFGRWMEKFPTLQVLAMASEDQILEAWQGLGYYARARNLHRAAQALLHIPRFPTTPEELRCLPGIGEYTAHAVAAFAFDRSVPVVDTNIARVLTRMFDYSQPVDTSTGVRVLRKMAESLLPAQGGRLHNSALMELGALVCKPRQPLCLECPLRPKCLTRDPEARPVKRLRVATKPVGDYRAFFCDEKSIWLSRSTGKWWRGLWILPELRSSQVRPCDHLVKFSVTHHRVVMRIWRVSFLDGVGLQKIALRDLGSLAMPSSHRRGLAAMLAMFHIPV